MDKVLQILIVFGLVILVIYRFIRGKALHYIPYDFIIRLRPPLSTEVEGRLIAADPMGAEGVAGEKVAKEGFEVVRDDLLFHYRSTGTLTIYRRRQGRNREMQELAVPVDCTNMAMDPLENRIYFEAGGYWFVYGSA